VLRDLSNGLSWSFETCRALGSEHEIIEHKVVDGTGHETIVKLPGRLRFLDLECSRSLSRDTSQWVWQELVEQGVIEEARRNLELDLFDFAPRCVDTRAEGAAWPSRLEAEISSAATTERIRILMEEIVRNGEVHPTPRPTSVPTLPPATVTPISTATPTPVVATATPTPIPPGDEIFANDLESGGAGEWSSAASVH
jgi:phage tail-like protein